MLGSAMLLCLAGQSTFAQKESFAIRTVLVSVTDDKGARIAGLGEDDFEIVERGVDRDITAVVDEEKAAELFLLVDTSVVFRRYTQQLRIGLQQFLDAIGSRYQVTLYEFGTRPRKLAGPTDDRAALSSAVAKIVPLAGEGAYLLDAISETGREIAKTEREEDKPPVIVVILTGSGPELSHIHDRRAAEVGKKSGATYHVVNYDAAGQGGNVSQRARVENTLEELTKDSAGSLRRILSVTAIGGALTRLAEEHLQPIYRVSFLTEVSPETQPDDLEISIDRSGAKTELVKLLPGEKRVEPTSP
jgi:hypothetical protein